MLVPNLIVINYPKPISGANALIEVVLQAGGACYSWRLLPPRWLGGGLRQSSQEACVVLQRRAL
jgi:hypothetical protein